jgi:hypothetical protein
MPAGFLFTSTGVLIIMYAANKIASDEWIVWGIIEVAITNTGLALLGNAFIHKVKSDLMRKNRIRKDHSVIDE